MENIDLSQFPRGNFTDPATSPGGLTCRQVIEVVLEYACGNLPAQRRAQMDTHLEICADCWASKAIILTEYQFAFEDSSAQILAQMQRENPQAYEACMQGREALRQKRIHEGNILPGDDPEWDAKCLEAALREVRLAYEQRDQARSDPSPD